VFHERSRNSSLGGGCALYRPDKPKVRAGSALPALWPTGQALPLRQISGSIRPQYFANNIKETVNARY
jgi:hypothetical protein